MSRSSASRIWELGQQPPSRRTPSHGRQLLGTWGDDRIYMSLATLANKIGGEEFRNACCKFLQTICHVLDFHIPIIVCERILALFAETCCPLSLTPPVNIRVAPKSKFHPSFRCSSLSSLWLTIALPQCHKALLFLFNPSNSPYISPSYSYSRCSCSFCCCSSSCFMP